MLSDTFQRRTTVFVLTILIICAALFCVAMFPSWIGLVRNADGILAAKQVLVNGELVNQPGSYGRATISFLDTGLRVLRLLLWMAIVVSFVRYINYLVFGAALRNAGEEEISSLLRTVLTVGIYIISFFIIFQTQFPKVELAPLFTGSAIIGIVVGLALQDTLGNLFAGIA
ncbi:MAG: mechanosensitive ion channel family protein, partial [Acidobacteriota bacterium]|nr:mechanosensitive ion channel family protein [Acidobacteriota bacterium]